MNTPLQRDIDRLTTCSNDWLVNHNFEKCHIVHFDNNNPGIEYNMMDNSVLKKLSKSTLEKDIEVLVSNDLKWTEQVRVAAAKANKSLRILASAFKNKTKESWKWIYCAYVQPHLEFAIQAWCPYLQKDIQALEQVQRRATKMTPELRYKPYKERLQALNLTTLEDRRARGDIIQKYKIHTGLDKITFQRNQKSKFHSISPQARPTYAAPMGNRNKYTIQGDPKPSKCLQRHNFHTNRIVNLWNS
jgi:ribonuclease P/MRP protein subunit RPP40